MLSVLLYIQKHHLAPVQWHSEVFYSYDVTVVNENFMGQFVWVNCIDCGACLTQNP